MKKIIWLFGQPGSGRKTLIDSIINNTNNVTELLDICGEKISVVDLKYDRDRIVDYHITDERDQALNSAINSFCKDDNELLLIFFLLLFLLLLLVEFFLIVFFI